jgi:alkanesulfonate monooxygenase SsuD/methylene tetrahydromethanopterin reductase-like flavin-dependent oxidoreductase (luciferase family)
MPAHELPYAIVGGPQTVRSGIQAMIRMTQADELMVVTLIRDPAAAHRSYRIVAGVCRDIMPEAPRDPAAMPRH